MDVMKRCVLYFFRFAVCLVVYLIIPYYPAFATGEFVADYDVSYAIAPTGKTIVTQHVSLTNQLPNFYPQEYSLLLDSDKITNIIAYDDGGIITPTFSVKDGKTEIRLTFNVKAIGLGKSLKFSLRYEHAGVANKNGSIWEVNVPGIVNDPDIGIYDVTIAVPPTFGPAAYLSPKAAKGKSWTKEQMIRGGITGAYGSSQNFDITLHYVVTNNSISKNQQKIALPPSTAFQKATLISLTPEPSTVVSDEDGNWLAVYDLLAGQTVNVTAKVVISTYLTPRKDYMTIEPDISKYLSNDEFWETKNDTITKLASTLTTPRQIYDYVSQTLKYDYSKVNGIPKRMGAAAVLKAPDEAVCTEFTDLFITIARAAGIPARRVVGYAYTNNPKLRPLSLVSDVLHAWPEYFDRDLQTWMPIDPTWANTTGGIDYFTKLDFNHIVFAMNGVDSNMPYPAGYYRNQEKNVRNIEVKFSETPPIMSSRIETSIEFPEQIVGGRKAEGFVVITNKGGEPVYTVSVSAESEPRGIHLFDVLPEILPFAVIRLPIEANFENNFDLNEGFIRARVNDAVVTKQFRIQSLQWLIWLGFILFVLSLVIGVFLFKRLLWKTYRNN